MCSSLLVLREDIGQRRGRDKGRAGREPFPVKWLEDMRESVTLFCGGRKINCFLH
jgi:hypothetical protein